MADTLDTAYKDYSKQVDQASSDEQTGLKKAADVEQKAYSDHESFLSKHMDDFSKIQAEGAKAFQPFQAPEAQDPLKAYGSTMAGLMAVASFFTHSSMVPAMNAATAAINAAKAGNTEAYNHAFDEWKANTEVMERKLNWETKAWEAVGSMAEKDYNAALGHAQAIIAQTKDSAAAAMIKAGKFDEVLKYKTIQAELADRALDQKLKLIEIANYNQGYGPKMTAGEIAKAKATSGQYSIAIQQGQKLIDMLNNAPEESLTGISGWANRHIESGEAQVGRLVGIKNQGQPARDFDNAMDSFRNSVRLLVGQSKYMSAGAREYIEELVKGDKGWDTTEDAKQTIQNVLDTLSKEQQEIPGSKFIEGQVYTDAKGNKAEYKNGQFVEVK